MNIPFFVTLIEFVGQIMPGWTLTEKLWGNSNFFAEKYLTLASRKNIYNARFFNPIQDCHRLYPVDHNAHHHNGIHVPQYEGHQWQD